MGGCRGVQDVPLTSSLSQVVPCLRGQCVPCGWGLLGCIWLGDLGSRA